MLFSLEELGGKTVNAKATSWMSVQLTWKLPFVNVSDGFQRWLKEGEYLGSSFFEYFNSTAQTLLFSLSKHLHPAFSFPLSNSRTRPMYQLFNFSNNSFQPFKTTLLYMWMNFSWMLWLTITVTQTLCYNIVVKIKSNYTAEGQGDQLLIDTISIHLWVHAETLCLSINNIY